MLNVNKCVTAQFPIPFPISRDKQLARDPSKDMPRNKVTYGSVDELRTARFWYMFVIDTLRRSESLSAQATETKSPSKSISSRAGEPRVLVAAMHGLVGVGKSTLCERLRRSYEEHNFHNRLHLWIVNYDDIVERTRKSSPNGAYDVDAWKSAREKILDFIRRLIKREASSCDMTGLLNSIDGHIVVSSDSSSETSRSDDRHVVVLDDNMYYRSMRYGVYKICRDHGAAFAQIHVTADANIARKRNAARKTPVPTAVLERLATLAEPPDPRAHRWERHTIAVPSDVPTSVVWEALRKAWDDPPVPGLSEEDIEAAAARSEKDRDRTLRSAVHSLDNLLRKRIGLRMQSTGPSTKATKRGLAKRLNEFRKRTMETFRVQSKTDPTGASASLQRALRDFEKL